MGCAASFLKDHLTARLGAMRLFEPNAQAWMTGRLDPAGRGTVTVMVAPFLGTD